MCSSSMAGDDGRGHLLCTTVAVILVLCSLSPSLTCFSLQRLGEQDKEVSEATVMEIRTGRILFNGQDLDPQSRSAFATENDGLLHVDLDHSDGAGTWEQMSQLEDATANEAAWRRLNLSLHCGRNKMKLKAMGPGAAHLKLQMGDARSLPLIQVPEPCGYSMKQNAMGLVLVVPYSGCNVIQENGNFVLPMSWLETPVKFTCPILRSPASTMPMPAQQPWKLPLPYGLRSLNRHKRQTRQSLPISDPRNPAFPYWYYSYLYGRLTTTAPATAASTTTAKPDTITTTTETQTTAKPDTTETTTTAKPDTTETTTTAKPDTTTTKPSQPVYPFDPWFLYYLYYSYYYPYYARPKVPLKTTAKPATTTPPPTTGPTTSEMTTKTPASTTKTPQNPYYRPYPYYHYPYPYYPPAGQVPGMPDNYYQIIQHYYGKPQYPQNQNTMPITLPPATTATLDETTTTTTPETTVTTTTCDTHTTGKPDETTTTTTAETTTTAKICDSTTTVKPDETTTTTTPTTTTTTTAKPTDSSSTTQQTTDSSPTTTPTTASSSTSAPTTLTTEPPTQTPRPSDEKYPGPLSPFSPYYQFPFPPYLAYRHKAGKFPDDQKYMPRAGYKSGFQAHAHPPTHPGFNHWQPASWFPQLTGQDMRPVDWKNLQPKRV